MKITKLGHCCLVIEENGVKILTDPGIYTTTQGNIVGLVAVLITHEHADHFHIDSIKEIIKNNTDVKIIANKVVGLLLDKEGISHTLLSDKEKIEINKLSIEAFDSPHAIIYGNLPNSLNTGFLIADKLFYPGDALIDPKRPVEILACPVAGPWVKLGEAIEYALLVKPKKCFPVHDAGLSQSGRGVTYRLPQQILSGQNIEFITPEIEKDFEA